MSYARNIRRRQQREGQPHLMMLGSLLGDFYEFLSKQPQYYTVQEAMEKFKITRDQLYHYTKYHQIPKIKKGKYTLISKPELDNLFEDPIIE